MTTTKAKAKGAVATVAIKKARTKKQVSARYVLSRQEQSAFMVEHLKNIAGSDKKAATRILQRAGILDDEGKLAAPYRAVA